MARPERKLVAVLAADVAGYSRLMRADEAGTLFHLKALRAEVIDPKIAHADLHCHGSTRTSCRALQQSDGRLRARNGRVRDAA